MIDFQVMPQSEAMFISLKDDGFGNLIRFEASRINNILVILQEDLH